MKFSSKALALVCVSGGLALLYTVPASALSISYETTANGTTGTGVAPEMAPVSDTYSRTFTQPTTPISGSSFGFTDDFLFVVPNSTADAITSTINLLDVSDISNLQVRLFSESLNPTFPLPGNPQGPVFNASWSTVTLSPGLTETVDVISPAMLMPGEYVLEVSGNVTGSRGGSYSGVLNVNPVPLPAALPLILSGLGLLGAARRRRSLG